MHKGLGQPERMKSVLLLGKLSPELPELALEIAESRRI